MGVFKKQGVYWVDHYVNGHRMSECIRSSKCSAEAVLRNHQEGKREDGADETS